MKKYYTLLSLLIFLGCNKPQKASLSVWDISNSKPSNESLIEIIEEDYQLIPLETITESLISRIDKIIVHDNRIYILDGFSSNRIKVFNMEGTFLQTIGKSGEGPGEYRNPVDFIIKNEFLYVYDNPDNLIKFNLKGEYMESIRTGVSGFKIENIGDEGFAIINGGTESNLLTTNKNFMEVNSFFPYKSRYVDQIILYPLLKTNKGEVLYRRYLNDTIFKISQDRRPNPYLFIDHGDNAFSLDKNWGNETIEDQRLEDIVANYSVNQLYLENESHQLLFYYNLMSPYFALRDKNTNNSRVFNFKSFNNNITLTPNFAFTHSSGGFYIGVVDPAAIFNNQQPIEEYPEKMKQIMAKIEDGDNPILIFAKFR